MEHFAVARGSKVNLIFKLEMMLGAHLDFGGKESFHYSIVEIRYITC